MKLAHRFKIHLPDFSCFSRRSASVIGFSSGLGASASALSLPALAFLGFVSFLGFVVDASLGALLLSFSLVFGVFAGC